MAAGLKGATTSRGQCAAQICIVNTGKTSIRHCQVPGLHRACFEMLRGWHHHSTLIWDTAGPCSSALGTITLSTPAGNPHAHISVFSQACLPAMHVTDTCLRGLFICTPCCCTCCNCKQVVWGVQATYNAGVRYSMLSRPGVRLWHGRDEVLLKEEGYLGRKRVSAAHRSPP